MCSQGGQYFVLAHDDGHFESPRGSYQLALSFWLAIVGDQAHEHGAP